MTILFHLILLTYIISMGWKIAISEGMLLEAIGKWGEKKVDDGYKIFDMIVCPWCVCTLMSIAAHAVAIGINVLPMEFNWVMVIRWPVVIMGASLLSGTTWTIVEVLNRVKEKMEKEIFDK